jgi:hypothetical protein
LSAVIAVKELLSELIESCGTDALELAPELALEPPLELDVPLLPHAARTRAALAARAAAAADLVTERKETTSLMGGTIRSTGHCRAPRNRSPLGRTLYGMTLEPF